MRAGEGAGPQAPADSLKGDTRSARKRAKLSFKEARELDELPAKLEALEKEQGVLAARLADPALYQDRGADPKALSIRHDAIEEELTRVLARWEELESKRGASS
jgi:ATP-binding cassette subfamily F protein uup